MKMYVEGGVFKPANSLEARVHAADFAGVVKAVGCMSAGEQMAACARLRSLVEAIDRFGWDPPKEARQWWGGKIEREHSRALAAALFLCGTDNDRKSLWRVSADIETLAPLLPADALAVLATVLIDGSHAMIFPVQALVASGRSARPTVDNYIIGLITVPQRSGRHFPPLLDLVAADPGLADAALLRVFEVEGTGDANMSSIEKYSGAGGSWAATFLELIRRGVYTRALLLEKTLGTLEMDWPQFRAGWFSRFHATLAPTPQEMAPLAERYAGLCLSRIAPTVTLALSALAALYGARLIDGERLLQALAPVMSSAVKGQVDGALKLLDEMVRRKDCTGPQAAALAAAALGHESADVHKKVVARLRAWGLDDAAKAELSRYLPHVSAASQPDIAALIGVAAPKLAPAIASLRTLREPMSGVDPARALAPITDMDELVQRIAFVFENEACVDDFECAVDGLARLAPFSGDAIATLSPVLKRACKLVGAVDRAIASELARLLILLVGGEGAPRSVNGNSAGAELRRRVDDTAVFVAQQTRLSPLDTPTHRRGFIHPDALVARIAAHQAADAMSSPQCQARAILRLATGDFAQARQAARGLAAGPFVRALRYALGDDVAIGAEYALFAAAARIRHPGGDDMLMMATYGALGPDGPAVARYSWSAAAPEAGYSLPYHGLLSVLPVAENFDPDLIAVRRHEHFWQGANAGLLLYGAAILPSSLEAFYASGAAEVGFNLNWWEARWQDKAYFTLLLDPTSPLTPMACLTLAFGLAGKEAGQTAMAIDAFVASYLDGRLDLAELAGVVRETLVAQLCKGARYAKSLATAARAHGELAQAVFALLDDVVQMPPDASAKELGPLLELMLELALAGGFVLSPQAGAALGQLQAGGKGKLAQKALLARCKG